MTPHINLAVRFHGSFYHSYRDDYLDGHAAAGSICIGQDTADGSFDGHPSWAEKWSNHRLWTGLERARILALQTRRLTGDELPPSIGRLLGKTIRLRHCGHRPRETAGDDLFGV